MGSLSEMSVEGEGDRCFLRAKRLQVMLCASIIMYVELLAKVLSIRNPMFSKSCT